MRFVLLALITISLTAYADDPAIPAGWTSSGKNAEGFVEVTNPKDGSILIYVPAGEFKAGDKNEARTLPGFYIGKHEITWRQYLAFCKASAHAAPDRPANTGDDHPVVNVDHGDATAYCAWAGMTLPTEWQWEKAARGTDGRRYPWGDQFDWQKCNSASWWLKREVEVDWKAAFLDGFWGAGGQATLTTPVGSMHDDRSPFGILDAAGNVWEWCVDLYETGKTSRVIRGGSWFNQASFSRSAHRDKYGPGLKRAFVGFRPARNTPRVGEPPVPAGWISKGKNAQGHFEVANPKDGSVLIHVPAGAFKAGDEKASRTLPAYYIGKYEITWYQYEAFCKATGRAPPTRPDNTGDDHPVNQVDHPSAIAYCEWADMTLPTEWQWEKAARGTDGRKYPWGNAFDWQKCNSASWWLKREVEEHDDWNKAFNAGFLKPRGKPTLTLPVGSFPTGASPCGALDMAGNAWEWCHDPYEPGSKLRVYRGGCMIMRASDCRAAWRDGFDPALRGRCVGFRPSRSSP